MIIEEGIESIARTLGLDPAQVRQENLTREGDLLHHSDKTVPEDLLMRCWEECLEQSDYWKTRYAVEL